MSNNQDILYSKLKTNKFIIIGTNVIENEEKTLDLVKKLSNIIHKYNLTWIFKISFDKANRTDINSYRGVSVEKAKEIFKKIKDIYNVPILTDIHEPDQVEEFKDCVDIYQVPAFLCRQTDLIKAIALSGKIIHIKKGQFCSAEQMHKSKEKCIYYGNSKVILCERGNFYGYNDIVVDPRNLIWLKSDTNIVSFDISHCLQTPSQNNNGIVSTNGHGDLIPYMGKLGLALDVDGLFLEVHPEPEKSLCDPNVQFPLEKLDWLLNYLFVIK